MLNSKNLLDFGAVINFNTNIKYLSNTNTSFINPLYNEYSFDNEEKSFHLEGFFFDNIKDINPTRKYLKQTLNKIKTYTGFNNNSSVTLREKNRTIQIANELNVATI
jgi:hypothetical protein